MTPNKPLRWVLLTSSKKSGGAAIACMRQARALEMAGHQVTVLAAEDWWPAGIEGRLVGWIWELRKHLQYKYYQLCRWKQGAMFSANPWPATDPRRMQDPLLKEADVIVLHWINHGFLGESDLTALANLGKPLLWHMHDQWAFTGGCHYSGACTAYEKECGSCPQLRRSGPNDLSRIQFNFRKLWAGQLGSRLALVAPSQWLADCAGASGVLRGTGALVRCIPNPFDAAVDGHTVAPRLTASPALKPRGGGMPRVFFAAVNPSDPRKGWELLMLALEHMGRQGLRCHLEVAGKVNGDTRQRVQALVAGGHQVTWLGLLGSKAMQEAYARADLFVIPSLQENFPNTILESFAAGTPVAGFAAGGIANMIAEGRNGSLAPAVEPWASASSKAMAGVNLASAMSRILNHPSPDELRRGAFESLEVVHPDRIARAYADLVHSMLDNLTGNS